MIAIKIKTKNDFSGNPRRGWLIIDASAQVVGWFDEDYGNWADSENPYRDIASQSGESISVEPAEYKRIRKRALARRAGGF